MVVSPVCVVNFPETRVTDASLRGLSAPEALLFEAVWILSGEDRDLRLGRHALLQTEHFRVGLEIRALVDICDTNRDGGCGLTGQTDAFVQRNLIYRHHRQHK